MNILVYNSQSAGDALISTHIAKQIKKDYPYSTIIFAVRQDLKVTTRENEMSEGVVDILNIISIQEGIDRVGIVSPINGSLSIMMDQKAPIGTIDKVIEISEWFSDLGIVGSQMLPYNDTDLTFIVNTSKILTEKLTIGFAGDLDWNRKWQNPEEYKLLKEYVLNLDANIEFFGVDCIPVQRYFSALSRLNNCHLLISPMGSLVHMAAGLIVDTISLTSVFPKVYDTPEFYKRSGWHRSIKSKNTCKNFNCITTKNFDLNVPKGWGNPPTEEGFWPKTCKYIGNSCVYNATAEDFIKVINEYKNSRV